MQIFKYIQKISHNYENEMSMFNYHIQGKPVQNLFLILSEGEYR